jgi:argininosuccinate lyase
MKSKKLTTLWGNAFTQKPSDFIVSFTAGRDTAGLPMADAALLSYDLEVNTAHVIMLAKTGCISASDAAKILSGLTELELLVCEGKFSLDPASEDVHTNIESWLTDELGIALAGKLHTARSRNDQVVCDMRLFMRDATLMIVEQTLVLANTLLTKAEKTKGIVIPGYTHHQHAMVTTVGHVLSGFAAMVLRDIERFAAWYERYNRSPLGNMASYGTSYPIDRKMTANLLGFDGPDDHSLDAITNRWEAEADLAFAVTVLMNHLSTVSETLIVLSMTETGMISLSDAYCTGSSVMPQKKNPDVLEIIKGKAALVSGQVMSLIAMGKGSFIGYNRDTQWAKYVIMDVVRECSAAPVLISGVIDTMTVNKDVMASWCHTGGIGATALMEQLAQAEKLPMRTAKIVVEKAVKACGTAGKITFGALRDAATDEHLTLTVTEAEVAQWQEPHTMVRSMKSSGSPGKKSMKAVEKKFLRSFHQHQAWLNGEKKRLTEAKKQRQNGIASLMKGGE